MENPPKLTCDRERGEWRERWKRKKCENKEVGREWRSPRLFFLKMLFKFYLRGGSKKFK